MKQANINYDFLSECNYKVHKKTDSFYEIRSFLVLNFYECFRRIMNSIRERGRCIDLITQL